MPDVFDFAKYFIQQNLDTKRNTFDGNMKLQKLLVLADLISLAERGVPLFDDEILAYEQGCIIEKVRNRYKYDCKGLIAESNNFKPTFSQEELDILNLTIELFGNLTARELSDLNHTFSFWSTTFENSKQPGGFKNQEKAVVSIAAMRNELDKVREVIRAFRETQSENQAIETINGVDFYYTPEDLDLTDDYIDHLYRFSLVAEEDSYSVYVDSGSLVIY